MDVTDLRADSYSIAYHKSERFVEVVHYQGNKPISFMRIEPECCYDMATRLMKVYDLVEGIR